MEKSCYILSVDAKDLYLSNNYNKKNDIGYNIRYKDGGIKTKKFINTADYSLDLIKLREVYERVYRNTKFSFFEKEKEFTTRLINVTFKYTVKEFNEVRHNTYVRFGYDLLDLDFIDNICIIDGELVGIIVNNEFETAIDYDILGRYFYIKDNKYMAKSNIGVVMSVKDLRNKIYKDGFILDGVKYTRFKRSSGSARVGKCLFIDEILYPRMHKWEMCGLKIKEGDSCDLAALESYISLTLSSIIDTVEINPENILVIGDYDSIFTHNAIKVILDDDKKLKTEETEVEISNSIWDGQSIGDISLFQKYPNNSMLLLRNRFFKSATFKCRLQQWFSDNNITDVSQLNGFTLAKNISDIKLITTPNSIKYLKFGKLEKWLENIDPIFGIVKYEKPTSFFNGEMVSTHYQLLNTLQMSKEDMENFLKDSLDYLTKIKTNPEVLRYYINHNSDGNLEMTSMKSKNKIVYNLIGINDDFVKTDIFKSFKKDIIKSYTKKMRFGHILVNGNYSTLFGNPVEMLQSAIGIFKGESIIGIGNVHSKRFKEKTILCSRSPHITMSNVLLRNNIRCELIDKYFELTNEIICTNSIGEPVLDILSGADMDSDSILITDNDILIGCAKKNYDKFKIAINNVESSKKKRYYTKDDIADLDTKTGKNQIGEIINLSQEINTIIWDRLNTGSPFDEIYELYLSVCKLNILSCIEIDKAKKEFLVETHNEMEEIKKKYLSKDEKNRKIKPNFFSHLSQDKGYYDTEHKKYAFHNTSMDYLQNIINSYQLKGTKQKVEKTFFDILNTEGYNSSKVYYDQVYRILDLLENTKNNIKAIFLNNSMTIKEKIIMSDEIRQSLIEYIGKLTFDRNTMLYILSLVDKKEYKNVSKYIISILFGYPNNSFFEMIKCTRTDISYLQKCDTGDIIIHKKRFKNMQKYTKNDL